MSSQSYLETIHDIRERLQCLNATLPGYQARCASDIDEISDVAHKDRALYRKSQQTTATLFQASLSAFSLCWETMTTDQRKHHLDEYIDCHYVNQERWTPVQLEAIRLFLYHDILKTNRVTTSVKWNGYFIEHIPEVECSTVPEGGNVSSDQIVVKYTQVQNMPTTNQKRTISSDSSFHTLRAQVEREKSKFYVTDREIGDV